MTDNKEIEIEAFVGNCENPLFPKKKKGNFLKIYTRWKKNLLCKKKKKDEEEDE